MGTHNAVIIIAVLFELFEKSGSKSTLTVVTVDY
jgi:hypothetical protein